MEQSRNYILIDGSYFVYYRYYALKSWWKLSKQEGEPIIDNPIFKDKFDKMFPLKIKEVSKKLKIKESTVFVGRDCSRRNIWRKNIYPAYKETRKPCDSFETSIFKYVQEENMFEKAGCIVTNHPGLEADDCLAILAKSILEKNKDNKVYIIANDADYIQLVEPNLQVLNLKYKSLVNNKTIFEDPKKTLFCKIVSGDKSDNIHPVESGLGIKKAIYYYENPDKFKEYLDDKKGVKLNYKINLMLVHFENIPEYLVIDFKNLFLAYL